METEREPIDELTAAVNAKARGRTTTPHRVGYATPHPPSRPQVVELTAKRWKAMQAIGVLTFIAGVGWMFLEAQTAGQSFQSLIAPGVVAGIGFAGYVVGATLAWWYHG